MAIYHLHVKVIGRKSGSSAVASAAYRSGSRLRDERLDRSHDFSAKRGVVHSEVMLPENAPQAWSDRERLWNDVEAFEIRKDAQLAREVEFAIPREMSERQGIELARDFARAEFVGLGMVADLNVHWDVGEDGMPKPHAHVMLTMRAVDENGFGPKVRDWNRTEMVQRWRERWAELANERLAELDIDGIVAVSDRPTLVAALTAQKLGLPFHPPHAVAACRDKHHMREIFRLSGLPAPDHFRVLLDSDPRAIAREACFPCVLKG